jgi:hypothetical protein
MDQARAWKHDTDLGNRLTDHAFGLLCGDAVLAITGRQNAGKLPDRCADAPNSAGFGDGGQIVIRLSGGVLTGAGYNVLAAGGLRGEEDEQA